MDINRVLSTVENFDKLNDWQVELKKTKNEDKFYKLISALVKFFGKTGKFGLLSPGKSSAEKKIAEYLEAEISKFWVSIMNSFSLSPEIATSAALKILLLRGKYAQADILPEFVDLLSHAAHSTAAIDELSSQIIEYDDLRFLFFTAIQQIEDREALTNLVPVMCQFEKTVQTDRDLNNIYYAKHLMPFENKTAALKYRNAHQAGWLHTLQRANFSPSLIKEVLTVMHARIIPNFNKPQLLMDFIVDAYEHGGAISLLSLNAIFVLIQYHQLDYPQFFTKLYELLEDGSLLASAHRARFLRLLDLFLTSSHLPGTIPASILKRLGRLCLFAPPGAIVAIIPFVYNQIKRHSTLMVMIHRPDVQSESTDPFNNSEKDPLLTNALDSSLWELQTLTSHYHPNVAAIAKIYSQPMRKPHYNLEHFLSHSYETLYNTEARRKRDREPDLEFEAHNVLTDLQDTWSF